MSNEILYILLPTLQSTEMVYLAEAIASDEFSLKENPKYINKLWLHFGSDQVYRRLSDHARLFV